MPGPTLRTDIVEVYVLRLAPRGGVQFLQLRRASGVIAHTFQPVMGHIETGETAVQAALRELAEETGYAPAPGRGLLALWQLEVVNTYYLARQDCIMLSPGFAAQVDADVAPRPDADHDALRWVDAEAADAAFMWPGQRAAVGHILRDILAPGAACAEHLRVAL